MKDFLFSFVPLHSLVKQAKQYLLPHLTEEETEVQRYKLTSTVAV